MTAALRLVGVTAGALDETLPRPYRTRSVDGLTFVLRRIADIEALSDRTAATTLLTEDIAALCAAHHSANFVMFRLDTLAPNDAAVVEIGRGMAASASDIIAHMATFDERRLTLRVEDDAPPPATRSNFLQVVSRNTRRKADLAGRLDGLERGLADLVAMLDGRFEVQSAEGDTLRRYAILVPRQASKSLETALAELLSAEDISAQLSQRQPIIHFAPSDLFAEAADA